MARTDDPEHLDRIVGDDGRRVVATFRSTLFNASEGFVQGQAAGLDAWQPAVVGLHQRGNIVPALADRIVVPDTPAEALAFKLGSRLRSFERRVARLHPALIHAHFAPDGLMALPLARACGVPLLTTLRGYDVNRPFRRLLTSGRISWMRYALFGHRLRREGAFFLAVSDALRIKAIERGFPPTRIATHYNGVDLDRFRPDAAAKEPGLILHVGRLVEKKGAGLLLDAFAEIRREVPEARLVVIGDGPLEAWLKRRAERFGAGVEFLGWRDPPEIVRWMQRASVLAVPSITARDGDAEGLPTVAVEAAAAGLAVVGSRHMGIPEAVLDGQTGFLIDEGDVGALAARLIDILRSPALGAAMGEAARRRAVERFDYRRQMMRLEGIYDRIVREWRGGQTIANT